MSIQEVLDGDIMRAIRMDGSVTEDILRRSSQCLLCVFVAEGSHVVADVGCTELCFQRHLLELHPVHASIGST